MSFRPPPGGTPPPEGLRSDSGALSRDRASRASQRVARNAVLLIAQPLLLNAISLVVTSYIIHSLGPEDFGRLTYSLAMKDLFASLAGLGLGAVTVRDLARGVDEPERYVGRMMLLRSAAGVLSFAVLYALVVLGGLLPDAPWAVLLAGSAILPLLLTVCIEDVFSAYQEMQHIARVRVVVGLLLTAAQVVALLLGGRLFAMVLIFTVAAYLTLLLAGVVLLKHFFRPIFGFDLRFTRRVLGQGLVFYSGGLLGRISASVDKLILERMQSASAVGVFGAGATLLEKLVVLPQGLGAAVYPALSGLADSDRRAGRDVLSRFVALAAILSLPMAVGGSLLAGPITQLLAGEGYPGAAGVLAVAIWTLPAWSLAQVFTYALSAVHMERKGILVVLLSTVILVAGNLLLVPRIGPVGSAWALVSSQWVSVLLLGMLCQRHCGGGVLATDYLPRTLVGLGLMALVVWASRDWVFPLPVLIGALIYGGLVGPMAWRLLRSSRAAAAGEEA